VSTDGQGVIRVYRRPSEFISSRCGLRRLYSQPGCSTSGHTGLMMTKMCFTTARVGYGNSTGDLVGLLATRRVYRRPKKLISGHEFIGM